MALPLGGSYSASFHLGQSESFLKYPSSHTQHPLRWHPNLQSIFSQLTITWTVTFILNGTFEGIKMTLLPECFQEEEKNEDRQTTTWEEMAERLAAFQILFSLCLAKNTSLCSKSSHKLAVWLTGTMWATGRKLWASSEHPWVQTASGLLWSEGLDVAIVRRSLLSDTEC